MGHRSSVPQECEAVEQANHWLLTQAATGETIAAVGFFREERKS